MKEAKSDQLGDRMKQYEQCTQMTLPRRTHCVIRLDGKAFHSLTKKIKAKKPFDTDLMRVMNSTATQLCANIMGAQFAYVQSDEISILVTDYNKVDTQAWFGGNVQKMVSVSASMATGYFNQGLKSLLPKDSEGNVDEDIMAFFDSRVFVIPDPVEVENVFIWRIKDWERNSLQMLARSKYSHKELQGKGRADMHELLHKKETNWANLPDDIKRGRLIHRNTNGEWVVRAMFKVPEERSKLKALIPSLGYE